MDKKIKKIKAVKIFFKLWGLCLVLFFVSIGLATNFFTKTVQETKFGNSSFFLPTIGIAFFLGVMFFGLGILTYIFNSIYLNKKSRSQNKFWQFGKFLFWLGALPLMGIVQTVKARSTFKKKILPLLFFVIILLPVWLGGYYIVFQISKVALGYSNEPNYVAGTGSMYPTFPKGEGKTIREQSKEIVATAGMLPYPNGLVLFGKRYLNHQLGRGDIVTFFNDKTKEITEKDSGEAHGFIKRIIGLPGDKIELREGIVYLNNEAQKEPYIAKARSTFGGQFLNECKILTIPENKLLVMGDNRKGSGDSRHELGLVDFNDVNHVLSWRKQAGVLDKNWHDAGNDLDEQTKIRLDKEKYVELLNEKRKEAGVKQLKYQPKLEKSAGKRGEVILKYDDFSFEATRSGYTMIKAMNESGYSNTAWGEAPSQGYYEAEELLENQFEFPESKKFLLEKDYQEIGIAEVEGLLNGCPAQVVIQHFAGYVPPNYKVSDIESWEKSLSSLKEILPSWEKVRNSPHLYKDHPDKSERIIQIIQIRISRIQAIVSRMRANQWLTSEERNYIDHDAGLFNEQDELAKFLNGANW